MLLSNPLSTGEERKVTHLLFPVFMEVMVVTEGAVGIPDLVILVLVLILLVVVAEMLVV
jgi:hypothetical protein